MYTPTLQTIPLAQILLLSYWFNGWHKERKKLRWFEHETIDNKKCDEHVFRDTNANNVLAMTKKSSNDNGVEDEGAIYGIDRKA